jgi:O-antigen/teichoic acid export membrane protein
MLIVLWRTDNLRLLPYAVCQTSLSFTNCLVTSTIIRQHFRRAVFLGPPNRRDLKSVFTYSAGLSALSVQNDGDNFALNKIGYAADAGRYGFAYRVVQLGLLPVNAFISVTHVSFLETHRNMRPIDRSIRLTKIALVYVAFVSAFILVAAPIAPRLLGPQFHGTDEIMRWLVPLIALRGVGTFAMNGLLGLGLNHLRTRILVINAAFTVVLYILLVPEYSWRGAAIATNASEVTLCVATWVTIYYCQRRADRAGKQLVEQFTDTDEALQAIEGGEQS